MLPIEAKLLVALKELGHDVHDLHIPSWGGCGLTIIQMTPRGPGDAEQAMLKSTMWEDTTLGYMSHTVVAVNRDVNIYDARDVMWAISVRTDWGKPVQQIFDTMCSPLRAGAARVKGAPYRLSGKAMINASILPAKDDFDWWDTNRAWPKGFGKYKLEDFVENYTPTEARKVRNVSHEESVAVKPGKYKPEIK
jgi:3-polyprenyl-4-hydroxybenzoate decarboxylase